MFFFIISYLESASCFLYAYLYFLHLPDDKTDTMHTYTHTHSRTRIEHPQSSKTTTPRSAQWWWWWYWWWMSNRFVGQRLFFRPIPNNTYPSSVVAHDHVPPFAIHSGCRGLWFSEMGLAIIRLNEYSRSHNPPIRDDDDERSELSWLLMFWSVMMMIDSALLTDYDSTQRSETQRVFQRDIWSVWNVF